MKIAIDCETTGLDVYHGCRPYFVAVAQEDNKEYYYEWYVEPKNRTVCANKSDISDLREIINTSDTIIFHNAKFDISMLQAVGVFRNNWPWKKTHDTVHAAHLVDSLLGKDLTTLAIHYLGVDIGKHEELLKKAVNKARAIARRKSGTFDIARKDHPMLPSADSGLWKADAWLLRVLDYEHDLLIKYAMTDVGTTLELWYALMKIITERGHTKLYEFRRKPLPIIAGMQNTGITLSSARLKELEDTYIAESKKLRRTCVSIAKKRHCQLELPKSGANNSLRNFIFNVLKLSSPYKTTTGAQSVARCALDYWATNLEPGPSLDFVKSLGDMRSRDTAINYIASYRRYMLPAEVNKKATTFRLHSSVNECGTHTLRSSSNNPNQQNISKKYGFNLRYIFGPAPGREWWSIDYENLELRIPAYKSGEEGMIDIFERPNDPPYYGSYHLLVFDLLHPDKFKKYGVKCKDVYKSTWYSWTKNFNFAEQYGAVESSGTADAAAHVEGAQRLISNKFPAKTKLNKKFIQFASKHGYVETEPDRSVDPKHGYRLRCPQDEWGGISPTIPFNFYIQGTACWVKFRAMIDCQKYLDTLNIDINSYFIIMDVHDELVFDFPYKKDKGNLPKIKRIQSIMENVGDDFGVPLSTSASYHSDNWSEDS